MLHIATNDQEKAFMRNRKLDGDSNESDSLLLDKIVEAKDQTAVCPRCGGDILYTERGNSHAIWCQNYQVCNMHQTMRGI